MRSQPSNSTDSNSGSPIVRPDTATRTGSCALPSLRPCSAAAKNRFHRDHRRLPPEPASSGGGSGAAAGTSRDTAAGCRTSPTGSQPEEIPSARRRRSGAGQPCCAAATRRRLAVALNSGRCLISGRRPSSLKAGTAPPDGTFHPGRRPPLQYKRPHLLGHRAHGLGVVQRHLGPAAGDQPEHQRGVTGVGIVAVLDGGGEPRRGHHREPGGLQQVSGNRFGVSDRRARAGWSRLAPSADHQGCAHRRAMMPARAPGRPGQARARPGGRRMPCRSSVFSLAWTMRIHPNGPWCVPRTRPWRYGGRVTPRW